MSWFMYGMFAIAGTVTLAFIIACPLDLYSAAVVMVGAFCAVTYLRMGDKARYF